MISVGITGGIGSGKTTVAKIWQKMGARVVFADDLAKELMLTDPGLRTQLTETFGDKTYTKDGDINKPHLIREAFENNRVDELNAIVHPAIREKTRELIEQATKNGEEVFAYEAAVLLNYGRPDYLDVVVLVTGDRKKRISRVLERDNVDEEDVVARMAKQPDFNSLNQLADFVIENNGTIGDLEEKSVTLYKNLIGIH